MDDERMTAVNVKRSQAILRMPVDMVDAIMILHDGERSDVILFVAPTEDLAHLLANGPAFIAVSRAGHESLVARTAIACLGVPHDRAPRLEEDLPAEHQRITVKLRSGVMLEGELRFIAPPGQQRTTDLLNGALSYLVLHGSETTYLIPKAHIAVVTEQ